MINTEKINSVIDELEQVSQNLKNINQTNSTLEESREKINSIIVMVEETTNKMANYDKKTTELDERLKEFVAKLEEIRTEYHKTTSAYEIVNIELQKFNAKLDVFITNIKTFQSEMMDQLKNQSQQQIEQTIKLNKNIMVVQWIVIAIILLEVLLFIFR